MPSPLFDFLFIAALFVPAAMYIAGVLVLLASLVVGHLRVTHKVHEPIEAHAH